MSNLTIPVTDLLRNFGNYANLLPTLDRITLLRDGRPFAILTASPEEKNRQLLSFAGAWKGTSLDNDVVWKKVAARKNRTKPIHL